MNIIAEYDRRLLDCLRSLDLSNLAVRVFPADPHATKYFGEVISTSFEGLSEGRRQAIVWRKLLDTLDEDDQARVEFVITDAPSERSNGPQTRHSPE